MIKKLLTLIMLLALVQGAWGQPQIVWQTSLLDTLDEGFETIGKSLIDGGFFAGGGIAPKMIDECGKIYTNGQAWICKFDANKNLLWSKCYGGSSSDGAIGGIIGLPDGGCAVLAQTYSFDGDVTGNHGNSFTPVDYWLLRLDADGNLVWERCFGGSRNDYPFSMISTLDHGLLVIGYTDSNDGDVGDHIGPLLYVDGWVMKLDSNFEIQWSKVYGGSSFDDLHYGLQLADSSYIITGQSSSHDYDLQVNYGNSDGWIIKLDPQGNVIWSKSYGGIERDVFSEVHQTADGGFVMCGETASNLIFTPANFQQGNIGFTGNDDAWVFRVDSNGDFKHAAVFGGTGIDEARPCELYPDGTLGVVAYTQSHDSDVVSLYPDKNNIWYFRVNEQDSLLDARTFGGSNYEVSWNTMLTDAGNILVASYTYSTDGDVAFNHSTINNSESSDGWLFEIAEPTGIAGIQVNPEHLHIFPNPFSTEATINITGKPKGVQQKLVLRNMEGITVWSKEIYYDYAPVISRGGLPPGIYVLTLEGAQGEIRTASKLIIQ